MSSTSQTGSSTKLPAPGAGVIGPIGYLAVGLGMAVLAGIVAASIWLSAANRAALETVAGERGVLAAIITLGNSIEQAQSGQRGFLLTGKAAYLDPYYAARREVEPAFAALARKVAGDPAATEQLGSLRAVIADKLGELDETLGLARRGDGAAALALVQTDRGQRDMETIRAIADGMETAEQAAVATQFAAINDRGRMLVTIDAAGLAGLVALAALLAYGIRRYVADLRAARAALERANRDLETSNATLERTVRVRTSDLVEANEEIQRFAYIVSHDLRAPLVNIMGFTSELETAAGSLAAFVGEIGAREPDTLPADVAAAANDDIPEAIRFIKASTAKMDRLIGAILRLSREGRRVLAPERLDMREVLASIADTVQHQASGRNAEIVIEDAPSLVVDRVAAEQIFGNLIDNAIKYLKPGRPGVVRVGGRVEGGMAVFEVRDNGRGIAPRDRERIFELFRRAGDQTVPGEGIGLAHVRALVRRLGGAITCDSVLDEGTVFRVRLPIAAPAQRRLAA